MTQINPALPLSEYRLHNGIPLKAAGYDELEHELAIAMDVIADIDDALVGIDAGMSAVTLARKIEAIISVYLHSDIGFGVQPQFADDAEMALAAG